MASRGSFRTASPADRNRRRDNCKRAGRVIAPGPFRMRLLPRSLLRRPQGAEQIVVDLAARRQAFRLLKGDDRCLGAWTNPPIGRSAVEARGREPLLCLDDA